jgi:ubiquinone/menaquinone biosynthesis C-methylase UbiE
MNVLERKLDRARTTKDYKKVAWFYNLWSCLTEKKAGQTVVDLADIEDRKKILEVACKKAESGNDFNDNTFDILINDFMVDLMPQEYFDKIAREFHRVLKPQGTLIVATFSFGKKKINQFWLWIAKHFPGLLTGCRPVSFKGNVIQAGFTIEADLEISQNTFPSEIIKARKTQDFKKTS